MKTMYDIKLGGGITLGGKLRMAEQQFRHADNDVDRIRILRRHLQDILRRLPYRDADE